MRNTADLTEGSLALHLLRLSLPLILGNILQQLYNTVDAAVIGRCAGMEEFAAVGVASSVMNLFLFAIVGACTGISVIFAQAYGGSDLPGFRREHFTALKYGLLFSVALCTAGILLLPLLLTLIGTPEEIFSFVRIYLTIVLIGLPASWIYNLYSSLLRAVGKVNIALCVLFCTVVLNLLLDLLFVARFGLGITGAAAATTIAQAVSALLCFLYLRKFLPDLMFRKEDAVHDSGLLKKTAAFGSVTGLHQCSLYIGKMMVQGAVNSCGTEVISAFTAALRIEGFANSFGDSGSAATSVLVAQNFGAGKEKRVRACFRTSLLILFIAGLIMSLILRFTSAFTIPLVLGNNSGPAFDSAVAYLKTVALFYIFCFTGNTFAGFYNGIGKVQFPFLGAASHITLRVILS